MTTPPMDAFGRVVATCPHCHHEDTYETELEGDAGIGDVVDCSRCCQTFMIEEEEDEKEGEL